MTDLIRRIKQEFACWYTTRENQAESSLGSILFQMGLLEIPHPVLQIRLLLYQKISWGCIDELLEKPLPDVAQDHMHGSFKGINYQNFFIDQKNSPEVTADFSGSYQFLFGEADSGDRIENVDSEDLDNLDEVIAFIRKLPYFPLSKFTIPWDEGNVGAKVERTEHGVLLRQLGSLGNPRKPALINSPFLEKILAYDEAYDVQSMIKEQHAGEDDVDYLIQIAYVAALYAFRNQNYKAAGLMNWVVKKNKVGIPAAELDAASFLTFSDCQYQKWKDLPQFMFRLFDTSLKLPSELAGDELFLESVAKYAQRRESSDSLLEEVFMFTPCARLQASIGTYFAKQVLLRKVSSADYELQIAQRLRDSGFDVPKPVGLAVIKKAPHVIFEYAENAINLLGQDSSYRQQEKLAAHLKQQRKQVYTALGQYVRRMFDANIVDMDMAARNFMVEFDEGGNFKRVFQVDFEKTVFLEDDQTLRNVTKRKTKEKALQAMRSNMTQTEKKYFNAGYTSS